MKFTEKVMDVPIVYQAFQNFVYTAKSQETIDDLLSSAKTDSVLDFGCGFGKDVEILKQKNIIFAI